MEITEFFEGTDLDINVSKWKRRDDDYYSFLPFKMKTQVQVGSHILNNIERRIDFSLCTDNGKLYFKDLIKGAIFQPEVSMEKLKLIGSGPDIVLSRVSISFNEE